MINNVEINNPLKVAFVKQALDLFGPWKPYKYSEMPAYDNLYLWPTKPTLWEMSCLLQADWYIIEQKLVNDYVQKAILSKPGREKCLLENTEFMQEKDVPYEVYDIIISFEQVVDNFTSSRTVFAYFHNEQINEYTKSLHMPGKQYDLFFDHILTAHASCKYLPMSIAMPYLHCSGFVRSVFPVEIHQEEAIYLDWRFTEPENYDTLIYINAVSKTLGIPLNNSTREAQPGFFFYMPPRWGTGYTYFAEMLSCQYFLSFGRIKGGGQTILDAISCGCICFGSNFLPYHKKVCHPLCLINSIKEFRDIFIKVYESDELKKEILTYQEEKMNTMFFHDRIKTLHDAVRIKRQRINT